MSPSSDSPPGWFTRALATPPTDDTVQAASCPIHVLRWGRNDAPGLVLVHGGAAHAYWWSFLAPLLAADWRVIALDLSGHGDSGRRNRYSHKIWADEVITVSEKAGFPGPAVIVGHSLGGLVAIQTAVDHCEAIAGAILVDAPVRRPDPESEEGNRGRAFRSPGTYPTIEEALEHFHLIPPQPIEHPFIVDHIARHSLRHTKAGWTWKFDTAVFAHALVPMWEQLGSIRCRLALLRGEHSVVVPPDTAAAMYDRMGRLAPVVSIPEAHHHVMLDQPLAFVAALRALLHDWEHSVPRRY